MATDNPLNQEDCTSLAGDEEADAKLEVPHPPPLRSTSDEETPKSSMDYSMVSSGSLSFEILNTSTTESMAQGLDRGGLEEEDLENQYIVDDERDQKQQQQQQCKSLLESTGGNPVKEPEDEETSQIKGESLDGSLVVIGPDDMHNSLLAEGTERTGGYSEQSTNSNVMKDEDGHTVNKMEMNDEDDHTVNKMEMKDESLGESLVVLEPGDFENSLSSDVNTQHITDRMIAGLMNSTDDMSLGENKLLDNVDKLPELTHNRSQGESDMMNEETDEESVMKDDHSQKKQTSSNDESDNRLDTTERKTTSEMKDEGGHTANDFEMKDESLGESLVVLGTGDFENSLSSEVNTQEVNDGMNSTNDMSHDKDDHLDNDTQELTHNQSREQPNIIKEEREETVRKDVKSNDDEDKMVDMSGGDTPNTETKNQATSDSTQSESSQHQNRDADRQDFLRKQHADVDLDKDDCRRSDPLVCTDEDEENGKHDVPTIYKTDKSVSPGTDTKLPEIIDVGKGVGNMVPLYGSQGDSMVVLEQPDEKEVTDDQVNVSDDVSTSDNHEDKTSSDHNAQQIRIPEQMDKPGKADENRKDGSLLSMSESLVVIKRDEVETVWQEEASATDQLHADQDDNSEKQSYTPKEKLDLNPVTDLGRLNTRIDGSSPESTYQIIDKSGDRPPIGPTQKVIGSIVESMPSFQMYKLNGQAAGGYRHNDAAEREDADKFSKDAGNYQRDDSLAGSCLSTDSFTVLSESSMSENHLNSETEVLQLQSAFTFTGAGVPVIESFEDGEEVTGGEVVRTVYDTNETANMTESETDRLKIQREYITGKAEDSEGYQIDLHVQSPAKIFETKKDPQVDASSINDVSLDGTAKMATKFENEESDSSEAEENVTGRKVLGMSELDYSNDGIETDSIRDHQFPSLSSESISLTSYVFLDEKGRSESLRSSQMFGSDTFDKLNESSFDGDGGDEINICGSVTGSDVNRSSRLGDAAQVSRSSSLQEDGDRIKEHAEADRWEGDMMACGPGLPTNEDVEERNTSTTRQTEVLRERNDENFTLKYAVEPEGENNKNDVQKVDEELLDKRHPQGEEEALLDKRHPQGEEEALLDKRHPQGEEEALLDKSHPQGKDEELLDINHPQGEEEALLDKSQPQGKDEELLDINHPQGEEEQEEEQEMNITQDVATDHPDKECQRKDTTVGHYMVQSSIHDNTEEDFSLVEHSEDIAMESETRNFSTDKYTGTFKQQDTTSDEGRIEPTQDVRFSEKWNDSKTSNEQDGVNHERNDTDRDVMFTDQVEHYQQTDAVGFQSTVLVSSEENRDDLGQEEEESGCENRNPNNGGPMEADDGIEMPNIRDTKNEENQQIPPSAVVHTDQIYGQEEEEEEEEDTTLTLEPTENDAQALPPRDGIDTTDLKSGKAAEYTRTDLEWYDEPVTIYVLREWWEYEDQKPKVRKDQQPITKKWIDVEKVKFLFDNFRLMSVLKATLPSDTSVTFDHLKTYMYISKQEPPFNSEEEYRVWWLETIQAVFQTVDGISAYLCNLDNITRDSTIESLKGLTYVNVRVKPTEIPETFLVLGTANVGSTLHIVQNNHHQLVSTKWMREVKVVPMSRQWTRWCSRLTADKQALMEQAGILDILANEDNGNTFVIVDIRHKAEIRDQSYIEHVLESSSERTATTLDEGEYQLLSHAEVKKYIDDHKLGDIAYHWSVRRDGNARELVVLADNQEIAQKVGTSIKSSMKHLDLRTHGTEQVKKLAVMERQFKGKLCWFADDTAHMINVYVTDDILEQVKETIELLGGRKSASFKGDIVTHNIHLEEYDRIKFLNKYMKDDVIQLGNALQVTVTFQDVSPDRLVIKISGATESVQAAHDESQAMLDNIKSFQHPNVELFIPQIKIDRVRNLEISNRCVIGTHYTDSDELDDEQLTFDNFTNRKTVIPTKWWTCGHARLGLVTGPVSSVQARTIVDLLPRRSQSAEANKKTTIFVPHPDDGKAKHDLTASIKLVFEKLSKMGENSVAFDLHHCCDWSFPKFLKVALATIMELYQSSPGSDPGAMDIVLAVPTDEAFRSACTTIESSGLQSKKVQDPRQVLVIKGDVTKEQTDVIVNTASRELDLSHGAVSKALSSRAGPQLQKECKRKYPKVLKYGELAVTNGYQLQCKKIFHGAFDTWPRFKRDQTQRKEIVGKFVTKCLDEANALGMTSISFPAIGTGNLEYPSSVVAKEMLQKIRRFMTDSKVTCLKKVSIVIFPTDAATFTTFTEENSNTGGGSSVDPVVDPVPKSQPAKIRRESRPQHKVYFRVTCSAADQMILVRKLDAILRDGEHKLAQSLDNSRYYNPITDLESEALQKRRAAASSETSGYDERSSRQDDEQDEVTEDMDATLKGSKSETGALHYLNVTSGEECCIIVRGTQQTADRTVVWDWLEDNVGVKPVGIAWPYRNNVQEALVTCTNTADAEKVLRQQSADFQATTMEQQVLYNIRASMNPRFSSNKCEIRENSGVTVEVDSSGVCQLVGNFPQIEAANLYIVSKLQGHMGRSVKRSDNSSQDHSCVDGITSDVYKAFLFYFHNDPSYNRYKDNLNSMRYSEVDRTIYFDGSKEFCVEFKKKLTLMKTDISCDQIDVEGRHFKTDHVRKILHTLLDSQFYVHISIPEEGTAAPQEMKVINLIGLDRNKVQAMKYQVLESLGMTSSRRNRRFNVGPLSASRRPDPLPVLPPPPSAKHYHLGDNMKVLAYEGNILYLKVDGIVNAANKRLEHGGGVAGAISEAADIQRESNEFVRKNGKVPVGTSCHTSAGDLKHYKYIIHTVGPRWDGKQQSECEQQLQDAIVSCILKADDLKLESIAIPAISAGIFSMPPALCVQQYCLGVKRAWSKLQKQTKHFLKEIHFVDMNAAILREIQTAFDYALDGSNLDPSGHSDRQQQQQQQQSTWPNSGYHVPTSSSFENRKQTTDHGIQGARPKESHLYPFKEFNNRAGIDKTTFKLTSEVNVHVYTCDILATRVDAVVCGQDKSLQCKSRIAARVKEGELSGKDFSKNVSEIKNKNRKKIKTGHIFFTPIQGFDTDMLIMVICPSLTPGGSLKECKEGVKKCVQNILKESAEMNLRSIALPVLGSGNDVHRVGDIAKVIVESILKFAQNAQHTTTSIRDIHFVNHDLKVTQSIVALFDDHVTAENARIRTSTQPKVYPGMDHRQECLPTQQPFEHERSNDRYQPGRLTYPHDSYQPAQKPYSVVDDRYQSQDTNGQYESELANRQGCLSTQQPFEQKRLNDRYQPGRLTYPHDSYQPAQKPYSVVDDRYQSEEGEDKTEQYQSEPSKTGKAKPTVYDDCVICMDTVTSDNVKTLPKCQHSFHPDCIDEAFKHKPVCPTCGAIHGVVIGNQPRSGKMNSDIKYGSLPGFERVTHHICIRYSFPDGIQESDHPNPGQSYKGTSRAAYLPDNPKGRAVHEMLKIAFKRRLTFTIGHSRTTGEENVVTWNDIHHKTNKHGGQQQFGYPDPEYLARVTDELAVKGVTEADIMK